MIPPRIGHRTIIARFIGEAEPRAAFAVSTAPSMQRRTGRQPGAIAMAPAAGILILEFR
jgi:hypothetical protein